MQIKTGDYVVRKSYHRDIIFRVKRVFQDETGGISVLLKGVAIRLLADAPIEDLEIMKPEETAKMIAGTEKKELEQMFSIRGKHRQWRGTNDGFFDFPGKVLHLDGDREYLDKSLEVYNKFHIPNAGLAVPEREQPEAVTYYLEKYHPGILVITGHDSLLKGAKDFSNLDNYRSSSYFAEAVRNARNYQPDQDALVIFAGACQSCYEELIRAGANFASSPKRVFIHIFDPVLIIERIAYTSIKDVITADDVASSTVTGSDGIGGIETRGQFRLGYPSSCIE